MFRFTLFNVALALMVSASVAVAGGNARSNRETGAEAISELDVTAMIVLGKAFSDHEVVMKMAQISRQKGVLVKATFKTVTRDSSTLQLSFGRQVGAVDPSWEGRFTVFLTTLDDPGIITVSGSSPVQVTYAAVATQDPAPATAAPRGRRNSK